MESTYKRGLTAFLTVVLVIALVASVSTTATAEPVANDDLTVETDLPEDSKESTSASDSVKDGNGTEQSLEQPEKDTISANDEAMDQDGSDNNDSEVDNEAIIRDISSATVDPIPEQCIQDVGYWDNDSYGWDAWDDEDNYWEPVWTTEYSSATPSLHICFGDKELEAGTDYTVEYIDNNKVGVAKAIIRGIGEYTGSKQVIFRVSIDPALNLTNASVDTIPVQYIQRISDEDYYCEYHRSFSIPYPNIVVYSGDIVLVPGRDFKCTQTVPDGAGTAKVTITGNGKYTGKLTTSYKVRFDPAFDISNATVSDIPNIKFSENGISSPKPTVMIDGVVLTGKEVSDDYYDYDEYDSELDSYDYIYCYEPFPQPGLQKMTIIGRGQFAGKKVVHFSVIGTLNSKYARCYTKKTWDYDLGEYTYRIPSMKYTGKALKPTPIVEWHAEDWYDGDEYTKKLVLNTDYTVSYKNNIKMGTATIIITGKGFYKGTITKTFKVVYPITKASVSKISNATYAGKAIKPRPTVKALGKTLKLGTDYTLSYKNNSKAGKATVVIKGKGLYTGSISKTFKIYVPLKRVKIGKIADQVPLTKSIKPNPTITFNSKKLKLGTDYTLSYKNNTKAGKATVVIKGKGYYKGSRSINFTILPKGSGRTITKAEFNRLKKGMTYKEAVCLIGGKGELYWMVSDDESTVSIYEWYGTRTNSYAAIKFEDQRLVEKYQEGLR